ncbi:MAG: hypothetical protein J4473_01905 [Candidatus Aenigmarchaeota archaeon]|nr:hypothetical protein [Candidatus Aenigmarchaeota archaeon]
MVRLTDRDIIAMAKGYFTHDEWTLSDIAEANGISIKALATRIKVAVNDGLVDDYTLEDYNSISREKNESVNPILDVEAVRITERFLKGERQTTIADDFPVSDTTIRRIIINTIERGLISGVTMEDYKQKVDENDQEKYHRRSFSKR